MSFFTFCINLTVNNQQNNCQLKQCQLAALETDLILRNNLNH